MLQKILCCKFKSDVSSTFSKNVWIAGVISFSFLLCGSSRSFTAYLLSQLSQDDSLIKINPSQASWLACLSSMCNPIGFLFGGFAMDVLGRKWSTKCLFLPFIAGWAMISAANTLSVIYVGVGLHGIASGMTMISSVYLSEVTCAEFRGFSLSLLSLSYMLGMVMCSLLECLVSWRYTACYFSAASIVMLMVSYLLPESPYWLIKQGRVEEAIAVIQSLRKTSDNYRQTISTLTTTTTITSSCSREMDIQREVQDIEQCVAQKYSHTDADQKPSCWGEVRHQIASLRSIWKQMCLLISISVLQKMSGWTPLALYTVIFFGDLQTPTKPEFTALIYSVVCFLSTFLVPYFVFFYDRRVLLSISCVLAGCGMAVALVYELFFYSHNAKPYFWTPIVGVYTYSAASTIGITSVLVMLPAELLPREISGLATTVFNICSSVVATIAAKTYYKVMDWMGIKWLLLSFSVICFLLAFVAITMLPETRGKSLREIQEQYYGRKKRVHVVNEQANHETTQV